MVKIRLRRMGKKGQPSYRIVVADSRSPRDGRFIETLGHYNPLTDPETVRFDRARALHWLGNGAQPTEAVERLLRKEGVYDALPRFHAGEEPSVIFVEADEAASSATPTPAASKSAGQTRKAAAEERAASPEEAVAEESAASQDEAVAEESAASQDEAVVEESTASQDEAVAEESAASQDEAVAEESAAGDAEAVETDTTEA